MKHFGDINKIDGHAVPIVDIITGGSPCQDLSVAGKRAGLAGERSGLFMEQIRIIKEMREHDRTNKGSDVDIRPRYMVWENVPGAFTSNGGEDFRAVLEETAKVAERDACIPGIEGGRWPSSGCIMGDGWSIAWRVHDAQFWGVPQRRKRIALVADFGGETAPEILFERKGVSGDTTEGGKEEQGAAGDSTDRVGETGKCLNPWDVQSKHVQSQNGVAEALYSGECRGGGGESYVMQETYGISPYGSNAMLSDNPHSGIYKAETSRTLDLNGGSPACNQGGMAVVCIEGNGTRDSHKGDGYKESETMYTLNTVEQHGVCIPINTMDATRDGEEKRRGFGVGDSGDPQFTITAGHEHAVCVSGETTGPLMASGYQKNGTQEAMNGMYVVEPKTFAMQAIGEYKQSDKGSSLKQRDYKDCTDLIVEKGPGGGY